MMRDHEKEKERVIKELATVAFEFSGSVSYDTLKTLPEKEIMALLDVLKTIGEKRQEALEKMKG